MHKLCPLLGPLRSKPSATGSEEERLRRKKTLELSLSALVDLTRQEASKFLQQAEYDLAVCDIDMGRRMLVIASHPSLSVHTASWGTAIPKVCPASTWQTTH